MKTWQLLSGGLVAGMIFGLPMVHRAWVGHRHTMVANAQYEQQRRLLEARRQLRPTVDQERRLQATINRFTPAPVVRFYLGGPPAEEKSGKPIRRVHSEERLPSQRPSGRRW